MEDESTIFKLIMGVCPSCKKDFVANLSGTTAYCKNDKCRVICFKVGDSDEPK